MQSTELVLYGGAQIDGEFLKTMDKEWAGVIRHIYGTTETMCSLYNPQPVGQHTRLRPGFYSRIRVIELNGGIDDHVSPGEEGELIVDATVDTVFTEYLDRPIDTANSVMEGWYYTGDLCVYYDDGAVELIGRVDDLIRSGGENIHPREIEEVLVKHPAIKEVAVIGTPHNKWGEAVTACVVGEKVTINELEKFFQNSDVAQFKRPRIYAFMENLPRNATNKIIRRELKSMLGNTKKDNTKIKFLEVRKAQTS